MVNAFRAIKAGWTDRVSIEIRSDSIAKTALKHQNEKMRQTDGLIDRHSVTEKSELKKSVSEKSE